ncbi:MAG TPA: translocation/assembly module TamB, partial [Flavobacterium sp.]|nr:translocation/assembly module TamB [Flavobacterium sp.]
MLLAIALSLPAVQTRLGGYATEWINEEYGTDINVERVAITAFGGVKLKTVTIRDHHKDTLIFASRIQTNILSFRKLYSGDLLFGDLRLDNVLFNIKTYKGERDSNFDRFVRLFDTNTPSQKKFLMEANNIYISSGRFMLSVENSTGAKKTFDFTGLDAELNDFKILGPDISANIAQMTFQDFRGLFVKNLAANFTYTKTSIQ